MKEARRLRLILTEDVSPFRRRRHHHYPLITTVFAAYQERIIYVIVYGIYRNRMINFEKELEQIKNDCQQ
jgi:hypothetical protein